MTNRFLSVVAIGLTAYLIHHRFRAEKLREQEDGKLWAAMIDNTVDGIITIAEEGAILSFNKTAEAIFGYKAAEVVGENVRTLMPEPHRRAHDSYLSAYRDSGKSKFIGAQREVEGRRKDGTGVPLEISVSEVEYNGRRLLLGVMRDITERRIAEARLNRTLEDLRLSNEDLEKFAYVASHDLVSPLRAIDNLSSWLEEDLADQADGNIRDLLRKLRGRVVRMERLLDDLLEYAGAGQKFGSAKPVKLAGLVQEVAELLSVPAGMTVKADESLDGIEVPRMPMEQVLHNLVGNAIKHHHRPVGEVTVSAKVNGTSCEFVVSDDGPGIPKRFQAKVFEMFQTLRPRDEVEGSGMGLALVKKLVHRIGGRVALQSDEDRGSRFIVTWPKQPDTGARLERGERHVS